MAARPALALAAVANFSRFFAVLVYLTYTASDYSAFAFVLWCDRCLEVARLFHNAALVEVGDPVGAADRAKLLVELATGQLALAVAINTLGTVGASCKPTRVIVIIP